MPYKNRIKEIEERRKQRTQPKAKTKKKCSKCKKIKPLDDFFKKPENKIDGHHYHCKECHKKVRRKSFLKYFVPKPKVHWRIKKKRKEEKKERHNKIRRLNHFKYKRERWHNPEHRVKLAISQGIKNTLKVKDIIINKEFIKVNTTRAIFKDKIIANTVKYSYWSLLDYTPEQLKFHLEKFFNTKENKEHNMSWHNYGMLAVQAKGLDTFWHISYIKHPDNFDLNSVQHDQQLFTQTIRKAFALNNIRPQMFDKYRIVKGRKKLITQQPNNLYSINTIISKQQKYNNIENPEDIFKSLIEQELYNNQHNNEYNNINKRPIGIYKP